MKLGTEVAALTAGLDALYRSTPRSDGFLDREGLIPVAVAAVPPQPLRDYAEARESLESLRARLPVEAESPLRRAYLDELVDSLLALVDTFTGAPISYADQVRRQIRVETLVVDEATLEGYRATLRARLNDLGYGGGDLAGDLRRWEAAARVPPDRVLDTMRAFLHEARARTSARMIAMDQEWLEPVPIRDVPFSAYCDYPGRQLLINVDYPYTEWSLKHLACHEAFPGHLVHLARREALVAAGQMPLDAAQVVTSSASSALFEGIADNGLFFLDWVETPADELAVALQRLRGALRCNAAWQLHAEGRPPAEIAIELSDAAFLDRATAESRLAFLRHGLRAPFVYAYWCGDMAVSAVWETVPAARRPEFWEYLYANMHTPATLRNFWS